VVKRNRVNIVVVVWIADDNDVAVGSKAVLAVDLLLAAVDVGANVDIDVVLARPKVVGALLAEVLICSHQFPSSSRSGKEGTYIAHTSPSMEHR